MSKIQDGCHKLMFLHVDFQKNYFEDIKLSIKGFQSYSLYLLVQKVNVLLMKLLLVMLIYYLKLLLVCH